MSAVRQRRRSKGDVEEEEYDLGWGQKSWDVTQTGAACRRYGVSWTVQVVTRATVGGYCHEAEGAEKKEC